MSRSSRSTWKQAACVAALAVGASGCDITMGAVEFKVREEKRFAVTGAARVNLDTFDGSIEVRGWDRPEVLIEVEKQAPDQATADAIKVDAKQEGGVVTIAIPQPPGFGTQGWRSAPSASIIASVPIQSDLVIRSGDGSVTLRRVNGKLDIRTDDGSIRVNDAKGTLLARTGDGSVKATDVEGTVDVETGDGSITLDGVVRGLRLDTNDGSIRLTARSGSAMESDWTVTTGDGSVTAEVPKGFSAEVDAESGGGRIFVEGLTKPGAEESRDEERDDHRGRRSARGTLGSGGKLLKLRTGDGSINVRVW